MSKQNENINLFVIEEDYRRKKTHPSHNDYCSGKAVAPILTKTEIDKFEDMHIDFELSEDDRQKSPPQPIESTDYPDSPELLDSLQKMNEEEQKLVEIKINLLKTQQELQNILMNEIDKKKKTIAHLSTEISTLQNDCQLLSEALGII
jgi:hypothetical protein